MIYDERPNKGPGPQEQKWYERLRRSDENIQALLRRLSDD